MINAQIKNEDPTFVRSKTGNVINSSPLPVEAEAKIDLRFPFSSIQGAKSPPRNRENVLIKGIKETRNTEEVRS